MERLSESDREIILACRRGEAGAWEHVLDQYQRLVFSIPLNYGLSVDDAADITQLTFTILIQSLDSLADDSRLGAWLATVARRHTWRLLDRRRRENAGSLDDLLEGPSEPAAPHPETMERWEQLEWLNSGLSALDERCRKLLLQLYFDQHTTSYAEVAERLGIPLGSIGPTRARCLERLRRLLGDT